MASFLASPVCALSRRKAGGSAANRAFRTQSAGRDGAALGCRTAFARALAAETRESERFRALASSASAGQKVKDASPMLMPEPAAISRTFWPRVSRPSSSAKLMARGIDAETVFANRAWVGK